MRRLILSGLVACSLCVLAVGSARAEIKLPSVLGDHMVLQRDKPLPIWGWADPSEEVTVEFGSSKVSTKADDKGNWKVTLPAMKANAKPQTLTVSGKNKIELKDILLGEVWVGSGQSNMEWSVGGSKGGREAIASADHPHIRLYHVPKKQAKEPAKDIQASWKVCTPKTVPPFSGVLYFFGLNLHRTLDVPVGLINSSWGGSPIQPWTVGEKQNGGMYNAMIAPLQPFAVRGVIWYQGESNMREGMKYRDRMEALIVGWRKTWGQDLPFGFVQIAPWSGYGKDNKLPELWEAQVASLKIPGTGMVVTTDLVDNIADIHPQNKKDVGDRLARWAMATVYGKKDLVYSGPLYKSMKVEGDKIRLNFAHTGGGLKSRDGKPLTEFEIAGEDGKFVPAEATIDGNSVVVRVKGVDKPAQVRFGWRDIANPNLMNKEGLPASPFRTKDWKGGTGEQ
jgi:sialate O-acetylesterase